MNFLSDILTLKNTLFRTAWRITLDRQEAEDIVQQTLIKVWEESKRGTAVHDVSAYAYTICRNLSLDFLRQHHTPSVPLDRADSVALSAGDDPFEQLAHHEQQAALTTFLASLPEKQRSCWQLRDIEGLSYKEIATILALSDEQVKINIFRARKALREHFVQEK